MSAYTFVLPPGEHRYGFTVRCGTTVYTFQLTTSEGVEWTVLCPPGDGLARYHAEFDRSAVPGASVTALYDARGMAESSTSPAGTWILRNRWAGVQDLVVVAYDASTTARALRVRGEANVPLDGPYRFFLGPEDATLADRGIVGPFPDTVPPGWRFAYARAWYVSPRRTQALLAYVPGSSGGRFPVPGSLHQGYYALEAVATDRATGLVRHLTAAATPHLAPRLPPPLQTPTADDAAFPTVAGLTYPHDPELPLHGFCISLLWSDVWVWTAVVAKNWMGRAAYTFPDLTALPGFGDLVPATSRSWSVTAFSARLAGPAAAGVGALARALGRSGFLVSSAPDPADGAPAAGLPAAEPLPVPAAVKTATALAPR